MHTNFPLNSHNQREGQHGLHQLPATPSQCGPRTASQTHPHIWYPTGLPTPIQPGLAKSTHFDAKNSYWYLIGMLLLAMISHLIGVDGGGTGTRVLVADRRGVVLAAASAGPSALGQGVASAWQSILSAIKTAFQDLQRETPVWYQCALGAGLSGVNHQPWREQFLAMNPGFARIALESDAYTALLAAHGGRAGVMVAAGTGSIAEALYADGTRRKVGGWGFPVGDEGSGAWLGLRAMAHAQQALDGRVSGGVLAARIQQQCGPDMAQMQQWCAGARQFEYAQLARLVFDCAADDPVAEDLLAQAATALDRMAAALDPQATLPLAIYGSVGRALMPRLAPATRDRCIPTPQDAAYGALTLVQHLLEETP